MLLINLLLSNFSIKNSDKTNQLVFTSIILSASSSQNVI